MNDNPYHAPSSDDHDDERTSLWLIVSVLAICVLPVLVYLRSTGVIPLPESNSGPMTWLLFASCLVFPFTASVSGYKAAQEKKHWFCNVVFVVGVFQLTLIVLMLLIAWLDSL